MRNLSTVALFAATVLAALLPAAALAQDQAPSGSFADLAARSIVEPGDRIDIVWAFSTTRGEDESRGRVIAITADSLTLELDQVPAGRTDLELRSVGGKDRVEIPADRIRSIALYKKSRRWGTLIGGATGMGFGFVIAAGHSRNEGTSATDCGKCYLAWGGLFGGLGLAAGWGIDLVRDTKPVVYSRAADAVLARRGPMLTFSPQITPKRQAVAFTIVW